MLNRIIKEGKLDLCIELIGGASDGMLCLCGRGIIRIPRKIDTINLISYNPEPPNVMPDLDFDEYIRVSNEKAILRDK